MASKFIPSAVQIAKKKGIDPSLFLGLINLESGFNPNAVSSAGAIGLTQLMPGTAQGLHVDPHKPLANMQGGAQYLASMIKRYNGNVRLALSAYNTGPGGGEDQGRIDNKAYVNKVLALAQMYKRYDTGADVGGAPMGHKKGGSMTPITAFIDAPSDLGLRANVGPLTQRAVADIERRAASLQIVAQPGALTAGKKKSGGPPTRGNVAVFDYSGTPLGGHWSSGGGVEAHRSRRQNDMWETWNAVDLLTKRGTPVYALDDGVVGSQFGALGSKDSRMAGLRLHLVAHDNEFYYAHMSAFAPGLKPGTRVKKGQLLGFSGTAAGVDHLHLAFKNGNPDYLLNESGPPRGKKKKRGKP